MSWAFYSSDFSCRFSSLAWLSSSWSSEKTFAHLKVQLKRKKSHIPSPLCVQLKRHHEEARLPVSYAVEIIGIYSSSTVTHLPTLFLQQQSHTGNRKYKWSITALWADGNPQALLHYPFPSMCWNQRCQKLELVLVYLWFTENGGSSQCGLNDSFSYECKRNIYTFFILSLGEYDWYVLLDSNLHLAKNIIIAHI